MPQHHYTQLNPSQPREMMKVAPSLGRMSTLQVVDTLSLAADWTGSGITITSTLAPHEPQNVAV